MSETAQNPDPEQERNVEVQPATRLLSTTDGRVFVDLGALTNDLHGGFHVIVEPLLVLLGRDDYAEGAHATILGLEDQLDAYRQRLGLPARKFDGHDDERTAETLALQSMWDAGEAEDPHA